MEQERLIVFGPFRLELVDERLWRGSKEVILRPKGFALLRYLVEHAGQLATKEQLFKAIWPEVAVSDATLTVCIGEIRQALGDDPDRPQFIQTVHKRGYRFVAPLTTPQPVSSSELRVASSQTPTPPVIGRATEVNQLQGWLKKALTGKRQVAFVTGESGIGKTTLVDAFLEGLPLREEVWAGRGQCVEHYGAGEAYLPMLEALGRLCRSPGGQRVIAILTQLAPMWLAQMPAFLSAVEQEDLQKRILGSTRERMLREMTEALEALTAERPLVLVLEDLQWSDYATLDLISLLSRRQESARLLLIGTYRPVEVVLSRHPLRTMKQELQLHGQCEELWLELLSEADVTEYLKERFEWNKVPARLAHFIHQRTDGNPLFMINVIDHMVRQELLVKGNGQWEVKEWRELGLPKSLKQMIEKQIERLSTEEQRVLEAASVAGMEFSAAAVAAGLEQDALQVEELCEGLARREQFLRWAAQEERTGETARARYRFFHSLYQEELYRRLAPGQRAQLHRRIGEHEEAEYGARARERAAELALHFERGKEPWRAVRYRHQAAENALARNGHPEAIGHLTQGLELLKTLSDSAERTQQELALQIALGASLLMLKGYAHPEVEKTYARARELCQQVGETPELFPTLWGLHTFYLVRAEFQTARELGEKLLSLAQSAQEPIALAAAHSGVGAVLVWTGELTVGQAHAEEVIRLHIPQDHRSLASLYGHDPRVMCLSYSASNLWALGYPDQALKWSQEAIKLAKELAYPYNLAIALSFAAMLHQLRREGEDALERAEQAVAVCNEQGYALWRAVGTIMRGWALTEQGKGEEGIVQMREGLAAYQATGAELRRPYFLALVAEAHGKMGHPEQGLALVAEARAVGERNQERFYEAELYRLKGELLSRLAKGKGQKSKTEEAERCFRQAIAAARQQGAKSLELRARIHLSSLLQGQGRKDKARELVAETYGWFTEGFETRDLQNAKALLSELKDRKTKGSSRHRSIA